MTNADADDASVLKIPLPDGRFVLSVMEVNASGEPSHLYRVVDQDGVPRDFPELVEAAKFLDADVTREGP